MQAKYRNTYGIINERLKNADLLVDLDADGSLGNIPDSTSASVVELMWHTLVDGAVHLDVDVITDLVGAQVGRQGNVALLPEWTGKEIPCPRAQSMPSRHFAPPFPWLRRLLLMRRNEQLRES